NFRMVIELLYLRPSMLMKINPAVAARLSSVLLLLVASVSCAFGQAAPRPAPQPSPAKNVHVRASQTLIDASLENDPEVDKMVAVYSPKVRELDAVIGT